MPKRLCTLSPNPCIGASQDSCNVTCLNHYLRRRNTCAQAVTWKKIERYAPSIRKIATPYFIQPKPNTRTTGAVMGGSQSVPRATVSRVARRIERMRRMKRAPPPQPIKWIGPRTWSMRPNLHPLIIERVEPLRLGFHEVEDTSQPLKSIDTNIIGHFECKNSACRSSSWTSGVVATNVRLYEED
jgi:hypothetical protein